MIDKKKLSLHSKACLLLGVDPHEVRIVGRSEFREATGEGVGHNLGKAHTRLRIYWVNRNANYDTYIHELLHFLFPHRPHRWIRLAAGKLADDAAATGGEPQYLLTLARKAARRRALDVMA